MSCCPQCQGADDLFNDALAARDLRRYRRRGPDASTRMLLAGVRSRSPAEATLLDIGGGVGAIGQELLASGFSRVIQVDASSAYIRVAQRAFAERGWEGRARFIEGDFVVAADGVELADVVTLDRVVCCYGDYEALLTRAAERSRELLAFSYPRDRWYVRLVAVTGNLWRRIVGQSFRTFLHAPAHLVGAVERCGFSSIDRRCNIIWCAEVFRRKGGPQPG